MITLKIKLKVQMIINKSNNYINKNYHKLFVTIAKTLKGATNKIAGGLEFLKGDYLFPGCPQIFVLFQPFKQRN